MKNVKPCPYCGGEVEVVKLVKRENEKKAPYRIQCYECRALVARGFGFPIETLSEGEERIKDYEKYMKEYWSPITSKKIPISYKNQVRDRQAAMSSRISCDDESFEIHDAAHRNEAIAKRGTSVYDS